MKNGRSKKKVFSDFFLKFPPKKKVSNSLLLLPLCLSSSPSLSLLPLSSLSPSFILLSVSSSFFLSPRVVDLHYFCNIFFLTDSFMTFLLLEKEGKRRRERESVSERERERESKLVFIDMLNRSEERERGIESKRKNFEFLEHLERQNGGK